MTNIRYNQKGLQAIKNIKIAQKVLNELKAINPNDFLVSSKISTQKQAAIKEINNIIENYKRERDRNIIKEDIL